MRAPVRRALSIVALAWLPLASEAAGQTQQYSPREFSHSGHDFVAVIIGSSHCGFSTWPRFMAVVDPMLLDLRKQAHDRGALFTAIGIAVDEVGDGLTWLSRVAKFDEVASGNTWLNAELFQFVAPGDSAPTTPTLLLLERTFSDGVDSPRQMKQVRLKRISGADSIMAFAHAGAPLPNGVLSQAKQQARANDSPSAGALVRRSSDPGRHARGRLGGAP